MESEWFEELPENCPPESSFSPEGKMLYRLIKSENPSSEDFLSQRWYQPLKEFNGVSECRTRSVSTFDQLSRGQHLTKLPKLKGSKIFELSLKKSDGLILNTGGRNHVSWWRSKSFKVTAENCTKVWPNE